MCHRIGSQTNNCDNQGSRSACHFLNRRFKQAKTKQKHLFQNVTYNVYQLSASNNEQTVIPSTVTSSDFRWQRPPESTLIPTWISNHMASKVQIEIIHPLPMDRCQTDRVAHRQHPTVKIDMYWYGFPNFNSRTVQVLEWISNFILHLTMDVIPYILIHPGIKVNPD